MIEEHKYYNIIYYCIGCDVTGQPIYATHFVWKRKIKPGFKKSWKIPLPIGFKQNKRNFKHDHNH